MDIRTAICRINFLPQLEKPRGHVSLKKKLVFTVAALTLYFVMREISIYGCPEVSDDILAYWAFDFAGNPGSILHLGLTPIFLSQIALVSLHGSRILRFDPTTHSGKATLERSSNNLFFLILLLLSLLVLYPCFYSLTLLQASFICFQMILGALALFYLVRLVELYGIGDIYIFFAAEYSLKLMWAVFSPFKNPIILSKEVGIVPRLISALYNENVRISQSDIDDVISLVFTLILFAIIIYFATMRIEVPLSYGRFKGVMGRYPIEFLYVGIRPMILTSATLGILSISLVAFGKTGGIGLDNLLTRDFIGYSRGVPASFHLTTFSIYIVVFLFLCVMYGRLWTELTERDPKAVTRKLLDSGMQLPGFRSPRIMERILSRYISSLIVVSSVILGIIFVASSLIDTIITLSAILITVTAVYKIYDGIFLALRAFPSALRAFPSALRAFLYDLWKFIRKAGKKEHERNCALCGTKTTDIINCTISGLPICRNCMIRIRCFECTNYKRCNPADQS